MNWPAKEKFSEHYLKPRFSETLGKKREGIYGNYWDMGERTRISSTNLKEIPSEKGRRERMFKEVTNFLSRLEDWKILETSQDLDISKVSEYQT